MIICILDLIQIWIPKSTTKLTKSSDAFIPSILFDSFSFVKVWSFTVGPRLTGFILLLVFYMWTFCLVCMNQLTWLTQESIKKKSSDPHYFLVRYYKKGTGCVKRINVLICMAAGPPGLTPDTHEPDAYFGTDRCTAGNHISFLLSYSNASENRRCVWFNLLDASEWISVLCLTGEKMAVFL